jgi:hypothetical protein
MRYSLELPLYTVTSLAIYLGAVLADVHGEPPGELSGLIFWALVGGFCLVRRPPDRVISNPASS